MTQPAATGPMRTPWTPATPRLLRALQELKQEVTRAQNAVQIGAPISNALHGTFLTVELCQDLVYGADRD